MGHRVRGGRCRAPVGYRLPAEWEPHEATWISWPHRDGSSFADARDALERVLVEMVRALSESEPVRINVRDGEEEREVRSLLGDLGPARVEFFHIESNEPWCRDHGPIFVVRERVPQLVILDWQFNAWGWKYAPFESDDEVPRRVGDMLEIPVYEADMVLEGGAVEVNGTGTLLTTESCLLNANRNPGLGRAEIELRLREWLGVRRVLWLHSGIEGDGADGHIDGLTRFIDRRTVVTAIEEDPSDPNYDPLRDNYRRLQEMVVEDGTPLAVLPLPMPSRIMKDGRRMAASYAHFYVANRVVFLPVFHDPQDAWAHAILENAFPDRRVVPIDCRDLTYAMGAFHCLVQQQPLVAERCAQAPWQSG